MTAQIKTPIPAAMMSATTAPTMTPTFVSPCASAAICAKLALVLCVAEEDGAATATDFGRFIETISVPDELIVFANTER